MDKQVISKQRVVDHGEVLTGKREVNAMLDLVKQEIERIDSRFLEPACGTGNFLTEILTRKLRVVESHYGKSQMDRIIETEVDVSVEKEHYILTGKIDLLLGKDEKLELLDFKSQPRPEEDDARLACYYRQLCIYAHILEKRYGKRPERLLLYWTGEPLRKKALMEFPYDPGVVKEAGEHFDRVVAQILDKDYTIKTVPEKKICMECDLRPYCGREGAFKAIEREE